MSNYHSKKDYGCDYDCYCPPPKKHYYYEECEYDCYPRPKKEKASGCTFGNICQTNKADVKQYAKIDQQVDQENTFVAICKEEEEKNQKNHKSHGC